MISVKKIPDDPGADKIPFNHLSVLVHFSENQLIPFPPIGIGQAPGQQPIHPLQLDLLREASFSYYRVIVELFRDNWEDGFRLANSEAKRLKVPMQVCLVFGEKIFDELRSFIDLCNSVFPFIEEVFVLQNGSQVTPLGLLPGMLSPMQEGLHHVKMGVGTLHGLDLLEHLPADLSDADFLAFSLETSTLNNRLVTDVMSAANMLSSGRQLYVTVINDTEPETSSEKKIILAADMAKIIKALIEGGVSSITAGETIGKRGLFPAEYTGPSAWYFLLREIMSMNKGFMLVEAVKPENQSVIMGLKAGSHYKIILINPTSESMSFQLEGISGIHSAKVLTPDLLNQYAESPGLYLQAELQPVNMDNNSLKFALDSLNIAILES